MIGHLKPSFKSQVDKDNYQKLYCSICNSLKDDYNVAYTLTIPNELVLVVQSIIPYFNQKEINFSCPSSLGISKRKVLKSSVFNAVSRMSIVLVWLKLYDKVCDEKSIGWRILWNNVNKRFQKIQSTLSYELNSTIKEYKVEIAESKPNYERLLNLSGNIAELVSLEIIKESKIENEKISQISKLFNFIGKIILISDILLDYKQDLKSKQYNPIIIDSKVELIESYDKIYSEFFEKYNEFLEQIKINEIVAEEFKFTILSCLYNLSKKIKVYRKEIVGNVVSPIAELETQILKQQAEILQFNSYCDCVKSQCEYNGSCCSAETCYGNNCYNAFCGGDWLGKDDSGCSCCGYSYWGNTCFGYKNCLDCMCGCGGNEGCCCSFDVWKKTFWVLLFGAIAYWIFSNLVIILGILAAIGVICLIHAKKK